MWRFPSLSMLLVVLAVFAGCDDPFSLEDAHVKVSNHTDRTITARSFVEMGDWCWQRIFDVLLEGEAVIPALSFATDPGCFLPFVATLERDSRDGPLGPGLR